MRSGKFSEKVHQGDNFVELRLRDRKFPWWVLLLLPLILLIPIGRPVAIKVEEQVSGNAFPGRHCSFSYTQISTFGSRAQGYLVDTTDADGMARFDSISVPLWYYLWGENLDSAFASCKDDCMAGGLAEKFSFYPYNPYRVLAVDYLRDTFNVRIVDAETGEPLAGARARIERGDIGGSVDAVADAAGNVAVVVPYCSPVKVTGSYPDFRDNSIVLRYQDIVRERDCPKLPLCPIKGVVEVIVRELGSNVLLANASVRFNNATFITNTNGVGEGTFDSIRIKTPVDLLAQKSGYADTTLSCESVEVFQTWSEEQRTMFLRPLTKTLVFMNTDGASPLEGVKNEIYINGSLVATEYSNRQGQFSVPDVRQDDRISIVSSKVRYNTNRTKVRNMTIADLSTQDSRTIPLKKKESNLRLGIVLEGCTCKFSIAITDPCGNTFTPQSFGSANCNGHRPVSFAFDSKVGGECYWPEASPGIYKIVLTMLEDNHPPSDLYTIKLVVDDAKGSSRSNSFPFKHSAGVKKEIIYDLNL